MSFGLPFSLPPEKFFSQPEGSFLLVVFTVLCALEQFFFLSSLIPTRELT